MYPSFPFSPTQHIKNIRNFISIPRFKTTLCVPAQFDFLEISPRTQHLDLKTIKLLKTKPTR